MVISKKREDDDTWNVLRINKQKRERDEKRTKHTQSIYKKWVFILYLALNACACHFAAWWNFSVHLIRKANDFWWSFQVMQWSSFGWNWNVPISVYLLSGCVCIQKVLLLPNGQLEKWTKNVSKSCFLTHVRIFLLLFLLTTLNYTRYRFKYI